MAEDCNCPDPIEVSNDCSDCSVECPVTLNSECVTYNGVELPNLNIDPAQGINDIFVAIDNAITGQVLQVKVVVPASSVVLLFTNPYTLINAPGSGKYIQPLSVEIKNDTTGVAYTVGSSNLRVKTTNATNPAFITSDASLTTTSTSIVSKMIPGTTGYDTLRINDPLVLSHQTANPAGGDQDVAVLISYLIVTV